MLVATNIEGDDYKEYILGEVLGVDNAIDYYAKNDGNSPFPNSYRFDGAGCKAFGLEENFEDKKYLFKDLFDGKDPRDPPQTKTGYLVQNWQDEKRRIGQDLTLNAPKSVSCALSWAETHDAPELAKAILEAHRQAVSFALNEIQSNAVARKGKGGCKKEKPVKLFFATIDHFDTRPTIIDGIAYIDPHLHSHAICFNFALCADGKTRALEDLSIKQQIKSAGNIYKAKLAEELQKAGLSISNTRVMDEFGYTNNTDFRLNGIAKEAETKFSKRSKSINDYMIEHNLDASRIELAVKATRHEKNGQYYDITRASWKEQFDAMPKNSVDLFHSKDVLHEELSNKEIMNLVHQFKKTIAVTKYDIEEVVASIYIGHDDALNKIKAKVDEITSDKDIAFTLAKLNALDEKKYVSKQLACQDYEMREIAKRALRDASHRVNPNKVNLAIQNFEREMQIKDKDFKLNKEQLDAVKAGTSGQAITILKGRAGTGKTATCKPLIDTYRSGQYNVIGTAIANEAAQKLEDETGMKSYSVTKLLGDIESGRTKINDKTLIYVDEAGMLDLDAGYKLAKLADKGARIVFAGDVDQLAPVGAGSALRVLMEELEANELKEIRRQKKSEDLLLANKFYDVETKQQSQDLYDLISKRDMVKECKNEFSAIEAIAIDYVGNPKDAKNKIVMATTNAGVKSLNALIQLKLAQAEKLGAVVAERDGEKYRAGDLIRFNRSIKFDNEKVINGSKGTVIDDHDGLFKVKLDNGKIITIPDDKKAFQLNYASTVHKSQGQSIDNVYLFVDGKLNRNLALVAFTRMKESFVMTGTAKYLNEMRNNLQSRNDEAGVLHLLDVKHQEELKGLFKEKSPMSKEQVKNLYANQVRDIFSDIGLSSKAADVMAERIAFNQANRQPKQESFEERYAREILEEQQKEVNQMHRLIFDEPRQKEETNKKKISYPKLNM